MYTITVWLLFDQIKKHNIVQVVEQAQIHIMFGKEAAFQPSTDIKVMNYSEYWELENLLTKIACLVILLCCILIFDLHTVI